MQSQQATQMSNLTEMLAKQATQISNVNEMLAQQAAQISNLTASQDEKDGKQILSLP